MTIQRYRGAKANMLVAKDQLEADTALAGITISVEPVEPSNDWPTLKHGPVVDLLIDLGVGITGDAVVEAVKAIIKKARHRGKVEQVDTDGDGHDSDSDA